MPLLWLSLSFLFGVLLASMLKLAVWNWLVIGAVFSGLNFLYRFLQRKWGSGWNPPVRLPLPGWVLFSVLCLGAARFQAYQPVFSPSFVAWYNDQEQVWLVEGIITAPPDERDTSIYLRVAVDHMYSIDREIEALVEGVVLANVAPGSSWSYGDRVLLQGKLQTPSSNDLFSYRDYLARQGVYSQIYAVSVHQLDQGQGNHLLGWIYAIKQKALTTIQTIFPDPEASLLAGILLGVESGIPDAVQQAFRLTGTSHIIVISGFNITILAGLFTSLFSRWLGRWRGAVVAMVAIAIYVVLVGADAPVIRAAILGCLTLIGKQIGRRQQGLNSLIFTAALMTLFQPLVLWDVGFQLSFAATLGLMLYAQPLVDWFNVIAGRFFPQAKLKMISGFLGEYVLFTFAAQITTLPITMYYFRQISWISLLVNPLILPVQPLVMVLGGIAVLLGLVYVPLGQVAAYIAWPFVLYTIRMVEAFASLSGGVLFLGNVALVIIILFYILLFGLTYLKTQMPAWISWAQVTSRPGIPLITMVVLALLIWRGGMVAPDGKLHITLIDVSHGSTSGEALLIQTPKGRYVLINGGPSATRLSDALGRRLPLGENCLDTWIIVDGKDGQVEALPSILPRFKPDFTLWVGEGQSSRSARFLQEDLVTNNVPIIRTKTGYILNLGDGSSIQVLAVFQDGGIILLEWKNFRLLMPFNVSAAGWEAINNGRQIGQVTALLLPDNGRSESLPPTVYVNLRPLVTLLSVSAADAYGRPDQEILDVIKGTQLLRTDTNGFIELITDGEQMWVEVSR
jgi:competence protein ComEC